MTRKEIINWVKANVYPQLSVMEEHDFHGIVRMVSEYRIGKNINGTMTANVDKGFLFINGEPVGRVESYVNSVMSFDDMSYYLEQRILARQGM